MADPKVAPAAHTTGTEVSTNEDEKTSGPIETPVDDPNATSKYYLKEGKEHTVIVDGEARALNKVGQAAELTASQAEAFQDKFFTAAEYKAHQAGKDALAEGAGAAALVDENTMEQPTINEHQARTAETTGDVDKKATTSSETKK